MTRLWILRTLALGCAFFLLGSDGAAGEGASSEVSEAIPIALDDTAAPTLKVDQQRLVESALGRFAAQGLELPDVSFKFHGDLIRCDGHKGMYYKTTRTLEMCSMDEHTMLHELAHAWANENLTAIQMEGFVTLRGLDSWNDHDDAWERRGTEHVAETVAWALLDEPNHVKWVETLADGTQKTTHRILSLGVDVEMLLENFTTITGQEPAFRDVGEWELVDAAAALSPEASRLGH